jgi:hypothetical protein
MPKGTKKIKIIYLYLQLYILPGLKIIIKSRYVIYLFTYLNSYCPKRFWDYCLTKKKGGGTLGCTWIGHPIKNLPYIIIWSPIFLKNYS